MREIAVAADLSLGNLYHYFRGKEELLYFCQDQTLDRLLAALAAARQGTAPLADRLRGLAISHVAIVVGEMEGSAAHLEVDALPPPLRGRIVDKRDRYERGVRLLIAEGIRSGSLQAEDATIATRAFLGALTWTAHWFRPEGPHSADHVAALVANYAVAGLTPRSTHDKRSHHAHGQRRANRGRVRTVQNAARGSA